MNYEQKYKEALERAMKLSIDGYLDAIAIDDIFPELKESEDERIRKELIDFVENWKIFNPDSALDDYAIYTSDSGECDKILAWLEKQGVQKSIEPLKLSDIDKAMVESKIVEDLLIERACEWLEENAYLYCDDQDALHESALIGDFRQAMKGD